MRLYKKIVSLTFPKQGSGRVFIPYKLFIAQSLRALNVSPHEFQGQLFDSRQYTSLEEEFRVYLFYYRNFVEPSDYSKKFYRLSQALYIKNSSHLTSIVAFCPTIISLKDTQNQTVLEQFLKPLSYEVVRDGQKIVLERYSPKGLDGFLNDYMSLTRGSAQNEDAVLCNLQHVLKCVDKSIRGLFLHYVSMEPSSDRDAIDAIIKTLIGLSDVGTCFIESLVQTKYNQMMGKSGKFIFQYNSIQEINKRQINVKLDNFGSVLASELDRFVKQCQDNVSEKLKPYVLKTGLDLSIISLAHLVKDCYDVMISQLVNLSYGAIEKKNNSVRDDVYTRMTEKQDHRRAVFMRNLDTVRDRVDILLNSESLSESIKEGLHGFWVKLASVGFSHYWATRVLDDMDHEYVADRTSYMANRFSEWYAHSDDIEPTFARLFEHVNASKDSFLQGAFLLTFHPSQFQSDVDKDYLEHYFNTIEKTIFLYPVSLKSATFFKHLLGYFCAVEDTSLKSELIKRIDQELPRYITEITNGMETQYMSGNVVEEKFFYSFIEDMMKFLIKEKRYNLLRLMVFEFQAIMERLKQNVDHSAATFLTDIVSDMGNDYGLSEYQVRAGFDFKQELESGTLLTVPDSDLPISYCGKESAGMSVVAPIPEPKIVLSEPDLEVAEPKASSEWVHTDSVSEARHDKISIRLKPADFDSYTKIIQFRAFASSSHVRIKLSDIQRLFKAFNTPRFKVQDDYSSPDNTVFGSVAIPQGTSHRKLQIGTRFYVDGELVQTLVSTKPITEVDGFVPDYQIKQLKAIFASLPICVEETDKESGGKIVSQKEQRKLLRL